MTKPNPQEIADQLARSAGTPQTPRRDDMPPKQPGRTGKAPIMSWHDPAVGQQLKLLAAKRSTTQQKLVAEALNMLFMKYGEQPIA